MANSEDKTKAGNPQAVTDALIRGSQNIIDARHYFLARRIEADHPAAAPRPAEKRALQDEFWSGLTRTCVALEAIKGAGV